MKIFHDLYAQGFNRATENTSAAIVVKETPVTVKQTNKTKQNKEQTVYVYAK